MSTSTGAMGMKVGDAVRIQWFGRYVDHVVTAVADESFVCTVETYDDGWTSYSRTLTFLSGKHLRIKIAAGALEDEGVLIQGGVAWEPLFERWFVDCRLFVDEYVK
jgi:hypothetical protein